MSYTIFNGFNGAFGNWHPLPINQPIHYQNLEDNYNSITTVFKKSAKVQLIRQIYKNGHQNIPSIEFTRNDKIHILFKTLKCIHFLEIIG